MLPDATAREPVIPVASVARIDANCRAHGRTSWAGRVSRRGRGAWVLASALAAFAGSASAQEACDAESVTDLYPPVVVLRVDNDLFGNQDQGYTNGIGVNLVSPNLKDYTHDPCLPALARWVNRYLERIQPEGYDQQNMVLTVGQAIYTPSDPTRMDLIEDDRPYAGVLSVSFGYHARKDDRLYTSQLMLGTTGPASLAEQSQDAFHALTGSERFRGWDNQLHNEPLVNFTREVSRRGPMRPLGAGGLQWDAIGHWGGAFGNFATHANTGFEVRLGRGLPDDFGSSPVRPAGNNTAPTIERRLAEGLSWHVFLAADARWVVRNITLDGNTFRTSHRVDKRPFVADAAVGFSVIYARTRFAFARYFRTQEFEGQHEQPNYGSFTISRAF